MKKKLSLSEWIELRGVVKTAKLLRVPQPNVSQWKTGYCLPRVEVMQKIKKITRGRVTYDSMIDPYLKMRGES